MRMKITWSRKLFAVAAASLVIFGVVPAGTAQAVQSCHWSFTTGKHGCSGSSSVRSSGDVIAAKIFSGVEYSGDVLTLWVPRPCSGNTYGLTLTGSVWEKSVKSGQAWSTCKLWLFQSNGTKYGPFTGNHPDFTFASAYITKIGIS
ncbi:hypothetical protein ACIRG5_10455 [Lentzea sp. NPDC102401]|uniref:hypothetical protein n=1 Tax=Lentzea sp. NPDC102401 TaxID=3364128 RepID=UPI0037FB3270